MATKIVENRVVDVNVGAVIELENGRTERLVVCDDWSGADFRFPRSMTSGMAVAVNVTVTGRTFKARRYPWNARGNYWVKVRVEFMDEDGPSQIVSGWMHVGSVYGLPLAA